MGSPGLTMGRQVFLAFLLSFLTLSLSSIRLRRQLNFGPQSTEHKQGPTNKVFFGLPNSLGSGLGGIGGSTGNACSCAGGGEPGDRLTAPRLGAAHICNCATSVEFGGDCKGRGQGDIFFGCGCGGPGNGIFAFSKRKKRQTGFGGEQAGFGREKETKERIFNNFSQIINIGGCVPSSRLLVVRWRAC